MIMNTCRSTCSSVWGICHVDISVVFQYYLSKQADFAMFGQRNCLTVEEV